MSKAIWHKSAAKDVRPFFGMATLEESLDHAEISLFEDSAFSHATSFIVEPQDVPVDIVTMNSIVKVSFLNTEKEIQFQIVYPDQANFKENKISIFSPVATALIGYKESDEIEWMVPSGMTKIRIDKIIYQPEAAGDYTL